MSSKGSNQLDNIKDPRTLQKRRSLAAKIVKEHFEMTLVVDRSMNYLWYMYNDGIKKGDFRPFMLQIELNLLVSLGVITEDEKHSIVNMLLSNDEDNYFIALLSIETLRNKRIKLHGKWTKEMNVSDEFKEAVKNYPIIANILKPIST